MEAPVYDHEAAYDTDIAPLVTHLIEKVCKLAGIPFLATFAYKRDADGELHLCTTATAVDGWQPKEITSAVHGLRNGESSMIAMTISTPRVSDAA